MLVPHNAEHHVQVRTIDLLPTIIILVRLAPSKKHKQPFGRSLMPIVRGEESEDRVAFTETGGVEGPHPSMDHPNVKSLRIGGWKLIYNTTTNGFELYDLREDPAESRNLYATHPEKARELWLHVGVPLSALAFSGHRRELRNYVRDVVRRADFGAIVQAARGGIAARRAPGRAPEGLQRRSTRPPASNGFEAALPFEGGTREAPANSRRQPSRLPPIDGTSPTGLRGRDCSRIPRTATPPIDSDGRCRCSRRWPV